MPHSYTRPIHVCPKKKDTMKIIARTFEVDLDVEVAPYEETLGPIDGLPSKVM